MDKKLNNQLKAIIKGHRPRPLMFCGYHNGKKAYVRKQDLTYWQLLEKYPPPFDFERSFKMRHIFQKHHHLQPSLLEKLYNYLKSLFG